MNKGALNFNEYVGTGRKVRITRNRPGCPLFNGYVLAANEQLALAHCFDDFEPDGYSLFRLKDVVGVRQGEYEAFWDHMLLAEGLLTGLLAPPRVDISSVPAAVHAIAAQHRVMIIQCEDAEEAVEDFYIGEAVEVGDDVVYFRHFDGLGRWESEPSRIDVGEITMIQFATPYIQRFSRYVR